MIRHAIVDTGPLVALLDRSEKHHLWAVEQSEHLTKPLLVCEAVLSETLYLLRRFPVAHAALFRLLENGALKLNFTLAENVIEVRALLKKYQDVPASLADACLILMTELNEQHHILTLDSDFRIYRKHGRQPIELICPS